MRVFRSLAVFLVALSFAASLSAQALKGSGGNIYGRVVDEQGGVLPGVTVTLSGVGAPQNAVTNAQGDFRFINLSAGEYTIKAELSGLTSVERTNVDVGLGQNTELTIPMQVSGVAVTVTVNSEAPLLDTRRERQGSNFSQKQLEAIPSSRDPWGVLQQSAGVLLDNVLVGSNNNGQQSVFVGKGTNFNNNAWNIDGIAITDLAAVGASPSYYDFEAFAEMQMTTGGPDPSIVTPGVTLNMVTKRGTNFVHGSGRVYVTPEELEAKNIPQEAIDQGLTSTNRIDNVQDYGVEVGGPLWKDKAWAWGSFGRTDSRIITAAGTPDNTQLEDYSAKINLQPLQSTSANLFYFRGDKTKQGRGASTLRPPATTWDQQGPSHVAKVDASQVFGSSFILSGAYSYANTPFDLDPQAGTGVNVYRDAARVWHNSYYSDHNYRPQHQVQGTATSFFNTGNLGHEVKFGAALINFAQKHTRAWPGDGTYGDEQRIAGHGPDFPFTANITRNVADGSEVETLGGFIGDTITMNALTLNLGLRYDRFTGNNLPSNVPGNTAFPDLLPALNYAGGGEEFKAESWQPRIGITYALGANQTTLLRASYSRFADQLGTSQVTATNPTGLPVPRAQYWWNDANGDHLVQRNELCLTCPVAPIGFDPTDPGSAFSPNRIDPDLSAPKTDEFIIGAEHQILPELVVGASYTYRERSDLVWNCPLALDNSPACISRSDYELFHNGIEGFDINGNSVGFTGPLYWAPHIPDTYSFGTFETNRNGYKTIYHGVELQLNKRLANKWMANASVSFHDWKQKVEDVATGCIDPTNQVGTFAGYFESLNGRGNSCADGDIAYDYNGLSWINSKWAFSLTGLYQLPLNFQIAGSLFGRNGHPVPRVVTDDPGDGFGSRDLAVGKAEDTRLDDVYQLDLSLQKVLPIAEKVDVTLSVDVFNVLNADTILRTNFDATDQGGGVGNIGAIEVIQNPRVLRFGARVSF